jgi:hypothetical protein
MDEPIITIELRRGNMVRNVGNSNLASKNHNDLQMLYQVYSSQIEFSKHQQWTAAYYGILLLGGVFGLSKLFLIGNSLPYITYYTIPFPFLALLFLTFLIPFLGTAYIVKNETSMCEARRAFKKIRIQLSLSFQKNVKYGPNYTSPSYDCLFWFPLITSLWIASFWVFLYLIHGSTGFPAAFEFLLVLLLMLCCGLLSSYFAFQYHFRKWYREYSELEEIRKHFWNTLVYIYGLCGKCRIGAQEDKEEVEEEIRKFVESVGAPPKLGKEPNLGEDTLTWYEENVGNLCSQQSQLLEFASLLVELTWRSSREDFQRFEEAYHRLTEFWEKCMCVTALCHLCKKHGGKRAKYELILLAWLEIVRVQNTGIPQVIELFKFARHCDISC